MNKLELLEDVMFKMYYKTTLPKLDQEDFEVMWKALIDKWDIVIPQERWEAFIEEVNCLASDDREWFTKTFKYYFI